MCLTIRACKPSYPLPKKGILSHLKSNCSPFTPKLLRSTNVDLLYLQSFPFFKKKKVVHAYNSYTRRLEANDFKN